MDTRFLQQSATSTRLQQPDRNMPPAICEGNMDTSRKAISVEPIQKTQQSKFSSANFSLEKYSCRFLPEIVDVECPDWLPAMIKDDPDVRLMMNAAAAFYVA